MAPAASAGANRLTSDSWMNASAWKTQLPIWAEPVSANIANAVSQKLTSAHLLLAMFTVENRAQLLLKERGIDEDLLLGVMSHAPVEQDGLVRDLTDRTREIAGNCGSKEADCLHMLIATTRVRCAAQDLLARAGGNLMPTILDAVEAYATVGEISDAMRSEFGEYQETVVI